MKEAIIVFNGCFCPVHAGHVHAMMDTKRKVEANGKFKVIAGYFAVASDGYVRRKLDGKLEPWMAASARVNMCTAVADDVGWNISAAEFAGWKQCGKAMVAQYHSAATEIFGVRDEAKKGGVTKKGDGETSELSSTMVRSELARQGYTAQAIDHLVGQKILGQAVGECLKQKLEYLRQTDCTCCEGTGRPPESNCPQCDSHCRSHQKHCLVRDGLELDQLKQIREKKPEAVETKSSSRRRRRRI
eukprot:CAMPEP_0197655948 /NCGR_PEP_ID=MMETSP1338-20131121/39769_1 /TAXON_ID=43686 ORGANISM="Pelagodinium beii, Strain RCC1491" /NCGR_SAMPLE_ID=MMETSP1338 /ASSEMBLY_ACC=CAM_ASM_000754 /LENGTH=243 /DNA_ID=CAMNT_0043231705 /DNA_START=52 /DNA_END=783 /DNA_ORIENTATION=+